MFPDGHLAAFALGSLASSRGASETATAAIATMQRLQGTPDGASLENQALIEENRRLVEDNAYLEQVRFTLESNIAILQTWGDKLAAELAKMKEADRVRNL